MIDDVIEKLDLMISDVVCELDYKYDYELLIATVLSAQCTDKRVNVVTKKLFCYSLEELCTLREGDIQKIIWSLGTSSKKAFYVKSIANEILYTCNGVVPCDFDYLVTLPGVGRKTASVVLSNLFDLPCIAVDTHVLRCSNRLGLVNTRDVYKTEMLLKDVLPRDKWNRVNSQLVLFGRYICTSLSPKCDSCAFVDCQCRVNKCTID